MARSPTPAPCNLRERIRRQEASGLTIEQFCSKERITRSKFHSWKRRFRLADSAEEPSPSPSFAIDLSAGHGSPPPACCRRAAADRG